MKKYRIRKFKKHKKPLIFTILKSRGFWIFVLFSIILSGGLYYLFFTDFFKVKNIEVSGNMEVSSDSIKNAASGELSSKFLNFIPKNIFLIDLKSISKGIINNYPVISSLEINRKLFNTLSISIVERNPVALACKGEDCYKIDKEGIAFEKSQEGDIKIDIENDIFISQKAINKDYLDNILKIYKDIKNIPEISIKEIQFFNSEKASFKTKEDWDIFFRISDNVSSQIENLKLILEQKIPSKSRSNLEYIDLRFGNKVYYKYRGNNPVDIENKDN